MNEFGIPYSGNKLTPLDMKRVVARHYRTFYTLLNGLINTLDTEALKRESMEEIY